MSRLETEMGLSEETISKRVLITVRGIVQGVGFRPFVYREAKRLGIKGFVSNNSEGVCIDAEGVALEAFIDLLAKNRPDRARIDSIDIREAELAGHSDFEIRESAEGRGGALIPMESAMCPACEREFGDPADRRYRYPFINCTDCGPRYTIIQIPPYDRVRTSMKHFAMCERCAAEYADPSSRRYHAEPISCPDCGPALRFLNPQGEEMPGDPIESAVQILKRGEIVALKGLGGFHLLCDATNEGAVEELRRRKRRRGKPLAVMFGSLPQLREYARISDDEAVMIDGSLKPIVIVDLKPLTDLSAAVAPGIQRIGVFLPYTPLHRLLFEQIDFPLVATSANISDEPIITQHEEITRRLGDVVDGILDHDRIIVNALDDAVVQIVEGKTVMLRMGRGYAPHSFTLSDPVHIPLTAVGAHQKSAVALAFSKTLVLGGHIGDLGSVDADSYFERTLHTFKRFYALEPEVILHDLHPSYSSTRYALDQNIRHHGIQHHYAHILACMAEYGLREKVLGFAFDGTGYGEDGRLWGGEALIADVHGYKRVASLRPFHLLGGDKAIKEPRRIALSFLFEHYTLDEVLSLSSPAVEAFLPHEIRQLHHMWVKKLNAPLSSSMGRVFDAVASLGGFIQTLDYEGQGGLIMEGYVDETISEPFGFTIEEGNIDLSAMVKEIIALQAQSDDQQEQKRQIASRFIMTVDAIIHRIVEGYPELPVVVAGGVFQNRSLMGRMYRSFSSRRFFAQQRTPVNDGSIALGQAWWGIHNC